MTTTLTAPARMQAVVATPGGARRIERRGVDVPRPAGDEVLVAVRSFSINRGELALLAAYEEGWRPGQDIAGEVIALGDGVSDLRGVATSSERIPTLSVCRHLLPNRVS